MEDTRDKLVFVYGSLMAGESNHEILKDAEYIGDGSIMGKMYSLIYFPAVVNSKVKEVYGEVYRVNNAEMKVLNSLEGYHEDTDDGMYLRRETICNMFYTGESLKVMYYRWGWKLPTYATKCPEKVRWHRDNKKVEE